MSRPGVEVTSAAMGPAHGVPTDTGVCLMIGEAAQGPTDRPTRHRLTGRVCQRLR